MTVLTVKDLSDHLNMTEPPADSPAAVEMGHHLGAAEKYVTDRCGPLRQAGTTYTVWPSGRYLVTPDIRLIAVTAVTDPDGATITPRTTNLAAGVIELRSAPCRPGPWTVTATAGATEVPDDLRLAVLIVAEQLWSSQRARGRGPSADGDVPRGFAAPKRALELMADYMIPGIG